VALTVLVALLAGACGNADGKSDADSAGDDSTPTSGSGEQVTVTAPGVSDTEIKVGGVASVTNPLGGKYGDAFAGVKAYFEMVNSEGGVHGRKMVLAEERDDKLANNKAEIDALIASDVFAIVPVATLLFSGADSAVAAKIPTFGWTINAEWGGDATDPRANLFGQTGSFLGFTEPKPGQPWLAGELDRKKIGVLAYNVDQSAACAEGVKNSFATFGPGVGAEIAFMDQALEYGTTDVSVQVKKMKDAGVDLVTTCMDTNGVVTVAKEMKKQQLDAVQYLPNGYDHEFIKEFGDLFEGSVVRTDFATWEIPDDDQPKGLKNYLTWMDRIGVEPSENSVAGWLNADLLVRGLQEAGPDFDRQKVVDAINAMTNYEADGFVHGVDWTTAHTQTSPESCDVLSRIENSEFVPAWAASGKPFTCVDPSNPDELVMTNKA
jgi:ABC-type branched-subunit amino acid transport system substrate-binding protein